ncbi:TetR/AcrR family transcriptional regulator [Gordonia sp. NPDC003376]
MAAEARNGLRYGEGREALLAAAVKVVAEQGLRKLSYRAVAREAGVAHGLVAHHFGTGDALLEAALKYSVGQSVASVSTRPGSGDLDALFAGLVSMVRANPHDQAFQYELILESRRSPELRPYVQEIYDAYTRVLGDELAAAGLGADPGLTHLVYCVGDGIVFQDLTLTDDDGIAEQAVESLRRLLRAAKAMAAQPPEPKRS